jgi:thiol-disulfide isomerase/thioredoxin
MKMKNLLFIISLLCLAYSCDKTESLPPNTYEVRGTAKGVYNGMRAYIKLINEKRKTVNIDTAIVMNEVFTFHGKVGAPAMRILTVDGINGYLPFVFESGITTIEVDKDNIYDSKIIGSINNHDYKVYLEAYKKMSDEVSKLRSELDKAKSENNKGRIAELSAKNIKQTDELFNYAYDFIKANPNSAFSLLLLESVLVSINPKIDKLKESLVLLNNVINKNADFKLIEQKIKTYINLKEAQEKLSVGKIAPNFTSTTPNGETLTLNDVKGKATIIDFWASWCKPCRIENPNVVKVYHKYHDKGLEIVSVSLDKEGDKDRWLKAIKDDNMNWYHVSNLKFWNEPVARLYNINAIPATFILDADGKIVAKKLRGAALEKQIAELLD